MATTTPKGPKALFPDETFMPEAVIPEALILQVGTETVAIEGDEPAVRVPYVTDLPSVSFTNEDEEIPEEDFGLNEVLIRTRKLALMHRASRESMTYPNASEMVANVMGTAITNAADKAFLNNASDPTGLLSFKGITDAGTMGAGDLDVLSDAITTIEAAGATASHIIMDPASWGALRKLKSSAGSNVLLLGSPAEQTTKQLFGIPVLTNSQMPAGTIIVVDKSDLLTSAGQIQLAQSDDYYFNRDSIAYRITFRFGWTLVHPERLAKIAVSLPTSK